MPTHRYRMEDLTECLMCGKSITSRDPAVCGPECLERFEMELAVNSFPKEELTCFSCAERGTCLYVDDLYNTGGDCLAAK